MKQNEMIKYDVCQLCDEGLENSGNEAFTYCNICTEHKKGTEKLKNNPDIGALN